MRAGESASKADRRYSVELGFEDVVSLKHDAKVGSLIIPTIHDHETGRTCIGHQLADLPVSALLVKELEVARSIEQIMSDPSRVQVVVAPISFRALTHPGSRPVVFQSLSRFSAFARQHMILELTGLEAGTPSSRISEAASLLKPYCRFVSARVAPGRQAIANANDAHLAAISVSGRQFGGDTAALKPGLLAFGAAAKGAAPMRMAIDMPERQWLSTCIAAGFTHAALIVH